MRTYAYRRILKVKDVTRTYITTNLTPDLIGLNIPQQIIDGFVSELELKCLYGLDFNFGTKEFPFEIFVTLSHNSYCITNYSFIGKITVTKYPFRKDIADVRGDIKIDNI